MPLLGPLQRIPKMNPDPKSRFSSSHSRSTRQCKKTTAQQNNKKEMSQQCHADLTPHLPRYPRISAHLYFSRWDVIGWIVSYLMKNLGFPLFDVKSLVVIISGYSGLFDISYLFCEKFLVLSWRFARLCS